MIELDGEGGCSAQQIGKIILDALDDAEVFAVHATGDGKFLFIERCHDYHGLVLTKEQVLLLADELRALAFRGEQCT